MSLELIVAISTVGANLLIVVTASAVGVRRVRRAATETMEMVEYRRKRQIEELGERIISNSAKVDEILRRVQDHGRTSSGSDS